MIYLPFCNPSRTVYKQAVPVWYATSDEAIAQSAGAPRQCPKQWLEFDLSKAEILTPGRHGGVKLVAESFVAIVFRKVKFCKRWTLAMIGREVSQME